MLMSFRGRIDWLCRFDMFGVMSMYEIAKVVEVPVGVATLYKSWFRVFLRIDLAAVSMSNSSHLSSGFRYRILWCISRMSART